MYNNGNGYQQQGGYQQGGHQQGGHQQGGYQQERPGLANQYYSEGQQPYGGHQGGYNQPPPQYQQNHGGYNSPPPNQSPYGQPNDRNQGYGGNQGYGNQGDFNDGQEGERGVMGALAGGAAGAFGGAKIGGHATGHTKTSGLVGAIAGAFAGHKLQDGVSDWKDERDEKKKREEEEKKQKQHQQENQHHGGGHHSRHSSGDRPRGGHFAGGFTQTSRDVRLDAHGDFNLHAQCRRLDGSYQSSTLSLNRILENDNGSFRWSTGNSSSSGGGSITVQAGDTLRAIAARHNCSFDEIARHNGIQNPDMIYPGQNLQLPGGGSNHGGSGNFGASARNVRLVDGGQTLEAELRRGGDWVTSSIVLDERIGNKNGCLELV